MVSYGYLFFARSKCGHSLFLTYCGVLPIDLSAMTDVEDSHLLRIVINSVEYSILTDLNPPAFL